MISSSSYNAKTWMLPSLLFLLCGMCLVIPSVSLAFPYSPSSLSFTAASNGSATAAQTVTFSKKTLVPRSWKTAASASWLLVSPASGTITTEQDTISVQVNPSGLTPGNYSGTVRIAVSDKYRRSQTATIPVTVVVTSGGNAPVPSMLLSPTSLSFAGTAGGASPLAKTIALTNPTGGTLTWTVSKSTSWLGLSITSGSTTTEMDQVGISVNSQGLAAGTYSASVKVTATGASNSPKIIPITLTLSPPINRTGSATFTWTANTETDLAGYKVYMGTQPGIYNPPITLGTVTSYLATNLPTGHTYYFSVTAFDTSGNESEHSTEVSIVLN